MKALLFDCDGVLVDTERDGHRVAFNKAFAKHQLDISWGVEEYGELVLVSGGKERMRHYFNQKGWPTGTEDQDELIKALHRDKTNFFMETIERKELSLRPGVARLVDEAISAGILLGVCSTSNVKAVTAVVHHLLGPEREAHFFGIFAGDMVKVKKPNPEVYLMAAQAMGVAPETCCVVEDTRNGLLAAKAAGMYCLITKSTYSQEEDFREADRVVSALDDAPLPVVTLSELQELVNS